MPAVKPLARALFQPCQGTFSKPKAFLLLPGAAEVWLAFLLAASKTWVHPAGTLPSSCWTKGGVSVASHLVGCGLGPLSYSPPPLAPSAAKERYSRASWLALSVCSKRTEISNKSHAVFRLAWDFPQGINHPYLGRRMPAFRSRPLAGGKGSLTLFPWFSLSTHDPVALLLWCQPLSSGSGEAPSVPGASAGSVGCCFLVSNGCSVQRNCKYLCKAPVLVIFSCSLIWDLPVVAFTQEHQSTF